MEKTPLLLHEASTDGHHRPDQWTFRRRLALVIAFVFVLLYLNRGEIATPKHEKQWPTVARQFSWSATPSRRFLEYEPCYPDANAKFECARLTVPLDHFDNKTLGEASLAVIRLPAAVPPTHKQYGGAILFNPGGPGGSGVDFLQRAHNKLSAAIHHGEERNDTKYYDFISFDPRGVGLSTPKVSCFTSPLLNWAWELRVMTEGILGSSDAAFGRLWSMSQALGGSCSRPSSNEAEDIKKFVSTASVAADMLEIVEEHGRWRRRLVETWLEVNAKDDEADSVLDILRSLPKKEKINYWGFSYGTYLGMTFASMFPDRIDRLIVDGVVDAVDYTKSLWFDNLADTEKEMQSFYGYCAAAGYPACALASATGQTTNATVEARVTKIIDNLIHNPLPVIGENPEIASYSDAKHLIFAGLYTPMESFPLIASILLDVESGNGSSLATRFKSVHEPDCSSHSKMDNWLDARPKPAPRHTTSRDREATMAIACSDGDSQSGLSREDFRRHWHDIVKLSPTIGPMWATFRMECAHWTVRANHRYAGPWIGNTSYPLLFIGNSADPVTPVRNAYKLAKGFKDAKVLEQGSSGHCSLSAPSKCTRKIVYQYFQDGVLPEKNAFCEPDELPFESNSAHTKDVEQSLMPQVPYGLAAMLMPMV